MVPPGLRNTFCAFLLFPLLVAPGRRPTASESIGDRAAGTRASRTVDLSGAGFVENRGQWDRGVRYAFRSGAATVALMDKGPVFCFRNTAVGANSGPVNTAVAVSFPGSRPSRPESASPTATLSNYYVGNDPSAWREDVRSFREVVYPGLYDGVDLRVSGADGGLKYEFRVSPGAAWADIAVRYEGAEGLSIDEAGRLFIEVPGGHIVDEAPLAYQEVPEGRRNLKARFVLRDEKTCAFEIDGDVDPTLPMVIDPYIEWGTYLGGCWSDVGYDIAVDDEGNAWVVGHTHSPDFPTTEGLDETFGAEVITPLGDSDAFVARFGPQGGLLWSTYIGGTQSEPVWDNYDVAHAIAFDSSGNAWVCGETNSRDFPTPGGFNTVYVHNMGAYLVAFAETGHLQWGSFLGQHVAWGISVDDEDNVLVCGSKFLARVTSEKQLAWVTPLGKPHYYTSARSVVSDGSGGAWLGGHTDWPDFPTPGGFDTTFGGWYDGFVAHYDTDGNQDYGTFLGGESHDAVIAMVHDGEGGVWLCGDSAVAEPLPMVGAFDTLLSQREGFAAHIGASGALEYGSYLGEGLIHLTAIDRDLEGDLHLAAWPRASRISVIRMGADGTRKGRFDFPGHDHLPLGIAADAQGNVWMTGLTDDADFPTPGGFDSTYDEGYDDAFVAKVAPGDVFFKETLIVVKSLFIRKNPRVQGADGFTVNAAINVSGKTVDWMQVPVAIQVGRHVETLPPGSFLTRNGITYTYTAPRGSRGISRASINMRSRRFFAIARGIDMGTVGGAANVRVFGGDFDGYCLLGLASRNDHVYGRRGARYYDILMVDRAFFRMNAARPNLDSFLIRGWIYCQDSIELDKEQFTLTVGERSFVLPAGSFRKARREGLYTFTGRVGQPIRSVRIDLSTGVFRISASRTDLSGLDDTVAVSIDAGDFHRTSTICLTRRGAALVY